MPRKREYATDAERQAADGCETAADIGPVNASTQPTPNGKPPTADVPDSRPRIP